MLTSSVNEGCNDGLNGVNCCLYTCIFVSADLGEIAWKYDRCYVSDEEVSYEDLFM